jgi:hypothetical protein
MVTLITTSPDKPANRKEPKTKSMISNGIIIGFLMKPISISSLVYLEEYI